MTRKFFVSAGFLLALAWGVSAYADCNSNLCKVAGNYTCGPEDGPEDGREFTCFETKSSPEWVFGHKVGICKMARRGARHCKIEGSGANALVTCTGETLLLITPKECPS